MEENKPSYGNNSAANPRTSSTKARDQCDEDTREEKA